MKTERVASKTRVERNFMAVWYERSVKKWVLVGRKEKKGAL